MGRLHWNLFGILKFTEQPKTPGLNFKNMASSEGDQLLVGTFHPIMDKIEADVLQIAKKWNWNESLYIKDTFSERFQLKMPVLHYCKVRAPSKLASECNQMQSKCNQNIEMSCKVKLKLTKLKGLCLIVWRNQRKTHLRKQQISAE